ncbi:MAG: antibiotic biosynthesis monooxygenase [Paracoccaceae bacterium]
MPKVYLDGTLVVTSATMLAVIEMYLDEHIALSRAEPGCEKFEVYPDANNTFHYIVSEIYETEEAFEAHQARAKASEWGQNTKELERRYTKRVE